MNWTCLAAEGAFLLALCAERLTAPISMWQVYAAESLLASACETVLDKVALVRDGSIDSVVATFYRSFGFFVAISVVGLLGPLGGLAFSFHWSILLFAPVGVFSSLLYTYLLRHVETTSIGAAAYITPVVFFLVDTLVLRTEFATSQILGMALLIAGGVGFSVDGKARQLKRELSWRVWGIFAFNMLYVGCEAYLFKYLNSTHGVNGTSFLASLWLLSSVVLILIIVIQRKAHLLIGRKVREYVPRIVASKTCDAVSAALWANALSMAAVSQITAFDAVSPLVLFVVVVIAQEILGFSMKEKLDRSRFVWKTGAVCLLVVGGFLVA
jgi:drug/metabolite transporter (DMT)-like permease